MASEWGSNGRVFLKDILLLYDVVFGAEAPSQRMKNANWRIATGY